MEHGRVSAILMAMPWDSSRPVPWTKLMRSWAIYAVFLLAFFLLFFRDGGVASAIIGVVLSLPLFLGMNWVLYKLGRERKTFGELRRERRATATSAGTGAGAAVADGRVQPAATKRTSPGHNNPRAKKRRR